MNQLNKFCVAVILYNPENSVLDTIKTYCEVFKKVFILDNSNIINKEFINEFKNYQQIEYQNMQGNKGISHTLNIAFHKAVVAEYDFILTMDQDSIFPKESIESMIDYIRKNNKDEVGIYAANYCRMYFNPKTQEPAYSGERYPVDKVQEVLCAITSGSFVKITALKKIIPLDENYFIANVDIDLSAQMNLNGYRTVLVGNVIFHQQVGGLVTKSVLSEKLRFTNYASTRYYYQVRNTFYLQKKYRQLLKFRLFTYKQFAKYLFKICTSEKNKIEKIRMGYYGYLDFKSGRMGKKPGID